MKSLIGARVQPDSLEDKKKLLREMNAMAGLRVVEQTTAPGEIVSSIVLVRASSVTPKRLEWLYQDRIVLGNMTLICGPPDVGKDAVMVDLISRGTIGRRWPDRENPNPPFDVVMLVSEEGIEDTVVPRLMVAGTDLHRVHFAMQTRISQDAKTSVRRIALDQDLEAIRKMLTTLRDNKTPAKLLVISPFGSYLGKLKKNSDDDIRPLMDNLRELAAECEIAIVCISHFNKNILAAAIDRTGGAGAIAQAPRCGWAFVKDDEDETGESRLMLMIKGNNVKESAKAGLRYRFVEEVLTIDGKSAGYPRVEWLGPSSRKIDDVLHSAIDKEDTKVGACVKWLEGKLANGASEASKELYRAAEKLGWAYPTVRRAAERLNVDHVRMNGSGPWFMCLPASDQGNR